MIPDTDGLGLVSQMLAAVEVVGLHGSRGGSVEVLGAAVGGLNRGVTGNLSHL